MNVLSSIQNRTRHILSNNLLDSITLPENQSPSTPFAAFFLHCLTLEDLTDRLSRNAGKKNTQSTLR